MEKRKLTNYGEREKERERERERRGIIKIINNVNDVRCTCSTVNHNTHTHNNHALYTFVCVCVPHGVIMKAVEDPYQAK